MSKRVLCLHYDETMLGYWEIMFSQREIESVTTTDSRKALELLRTGIFDALIQNMAREDYSGLEMYWLMRSEPDLSEIPIIVISGWVPELVAMNGKGLKIRFGEKSIATYEQFLSPLVDGGNTIHVLGYLSAPFSRQDFEDTIHLLG